MNDSPNRAESTLTPELAQYNSEANPNPSSSSNHLTASPNSKKKAKAESSTKPQYGKQAYRLPKSLDKAVRYSAFRLEDRPSAPQTPQAVVEKAVRMYVDVLKAKAKIDFPQDILDALAHYDLT